MMHRLFGAQQYDIRKHKVIEVRSGRQTNEVLTWIVGDEARSKVLLQSPRRQMGGVRSAAMLPAVGTGTDGQGAAPSSRERFRILGEIHFHFAAMYR